MFFQQLRLLLWKNFILRKRHWLRTVIEILWPIFLFAILVGIRKSQLVETVQECHYPARALPSAGVFPWVKSLVCDLQNPCFQTEVPSEIPGQINDQATLNTSSIDPLVIAQLTTLLTSDSTTTGLNETANDLQTLTTLTQDITTALSDSGQTISPAALITAISTNNPATITQDPAISGQITQAANLVQGLGLPTGVLQAVPLLQAVDLSSLNGLNSSFSLSDFCGHPYATSSSGGLNSIFSDGSAIGIGGLNISDENFCSSFIDYFESNDQFRFFWETAKPLLLGKIAYSPNTELVRKIITRANATFESLGFLQSVGESWQSTIGPNLYQTLESGTTIQTLRDTLENDVTFNLLATQLNVPVATLQQLRDFLSNNDNPNDNVTTWKDLYRQFDGIIIAVTKILQCFELNKFVGFDTESELVDYSLLLVANKTLWGSVVFTSPSDNTDDTLPNVVSYKIRQDAGFVTRTTSVQRYFWRPGAEDGVDRVKYYVNGFIHIQDMIENSIIRVKLNDSGVSNEFENFLGKHMQQFPYPCYTRDSYWEPDANADATDNEMAYYYGGFLFIQDILDRGIISLVQTNSSDNESSLDPERFLGVYMQEFPYPCFTEDEFLEYLAVMLSLLLTLAWIYSVCVIIKNIVYEKEQRLKEVMKMMGLSNGVHWVAWFIDSLTIMFCSIILLLIILWAGDITPFSNMFIVFLWLLCFSIATITLCFLISCFFSRANLAAACGGIIFFLLFLPYNLVYAFEEDMTLATKIIACLLSNVAFGYGANYISQYEMSGDGIQFFNWNSSPDPNDDISFVITLIMMLVDAVIYMLLAWYIENVFPGTYGVPKRWYFFVQRDYWCGTSSDMTSLDDEAYQNDVLAPGVKLEAEPKHLTLGVSLHKLKKVYDNGKVAVNNLSLNFYEGQITSFLGHNGAGKTTTMSMLTGLFTPSSGTATIYGSDIRHQIDRIRRQLGFCPQHNVLFGDLTVLEHLQFYTGLKRAVGSVSQDKNEIEEMLNDVGLPHKKDEVSKHLSGGMKRKLSVAVAFVGGSKCVILDEPTAGVDPYARRGIWDLLLRYRTDRTIILSTHHMDEADLLGDRIAIISHGSLKCCGSSLFLKSSFGVGYYLTVVKKNELGKESDGNANLPKNNSGSFKDKASDEGFESANVSSAASSSSSLSARNEDPGVVYHSNDAARSAQITNLVLRTVPKSKIHEENPREVTFVLPYLAQSDGKFSELFTQLDQNNLTYGLTDTSLEEIFLNVAEQSYDEGKEEKTKCCFCIPRRKKKAVAQAPAVNDTEDQARSGLRRRNTERSTNSDFFSIPPTTANGHRQSVTPDLVDDVIDGNVVEVGDGLSDGSMGKGSYKVIGRKLVWQQFRALLVKRFHHARRNKKGVIAQVIVPAVFIALALAFTLVIPQIRNYPALELQPWMYGNTRTFYSNDLPTSNLSSKTSQALFDSPSLGMRCVEGYTVVNFDDDLVLCDKQQTGDWGVENNARSTSQDVNATTLTCVCTDKETRVLLAECPDTITGGEFTPLATLQTSDMMYNMTGKNISDWLVKTVYEFVQQRYGGLSIGEIFHFPINAEQVAAILQFLEANSNQTLNLGTNNETAAALLQSFARTENAKVWFDNNGYHSMPTWLNILNNAALRSSLPAGEDPKNYGIVVFNHPLNFTQSTVDLAALTQSITDTLISISVIFALSFVPASFVLFLIDEKTSKAKHLQFVSGVNQAIYWVSTYLWDMINYMVPTIIVLVIFLCFQTKAYVSADNFPCLFLLLILYGFAITPMMYPASFYFEVPSTAYVVLTCVNLFIGINTSIATFILELLDDPVLTEVNNYLVQVFLIFPQYCLGRGLIDMALNQAYADAYASFGINRFRDPFTFDLVGRNLMAMAIEGLGFFAITLLIQYRFFVKPRSVMVSDLKAPYNEEEYDEDVVAEKKRILSGESHDILQVKNLTKIYKKAGAKKNLIAVDRLCIGVPEGECFGLLGVNGAGKTTTFKMLTGDIVPTAGDASILKQSILDSLREVQQNTGYCPQFEALNALLTGREHLIFYAKLRGVPPEDTDRVADWGINNFGLKQYANKPAGTYSGGNKRKLSAAIAFIGCPPVVFLDEPTAGMDPMSRRFLWGRIGEAVRGGRCIVLTSHSMEECEALCTRLAIMVNGKLQCIGSPQHLKNKYGEGYTITVKVGGLNPNFEAVQNFITESFPGAMLKESHCNMLMYQLLEEAKLKDVFNEMEVNKEKLNIEDYSISQTTLDEVFVSFAKNQTDGVVVEEHLPMSSSKFDASDEVPGSDGVVMQSMYSSYTNNAVESETL